MKNKIIFLSIKLQKSLIQSSLIRPIFNKEKRIIIPKIGAGKAILKTSKTNLDKYKIQNIIPKPNIKFFIVKLLYSKPKKVLIIVFLWYKIKS